MEAAEKKRLPAFEKFIDGLRAIWSAETDTERRMVRAKTILEGFVADPIVQAHSKSWPSTETPRSNLLLYEDGDYGFVINAVVRDAGRVGSVHDHAHAWVLYGVTDGTESLERYDRIDDGSKPGYAEVKLTSDTPGTAGKVDLVPPYAIHREKGGPTRSVAVIIRSERLVGRVLQHQYDPEKRTVTEGSGPAQRPFDLLVS